MILRAKYALLEPGRVVKDVQLEVSGPNIYAVHSGYAPHRALPDIDFGDAVITPGFVNPHCHLELEFCKDKAPFSGSFVDWLQHVRNLKREHGGTTRFPKDSLLQMAAVGCTTVVDHHTSELDYEDINSVGLSHVPLKEFFEFNNHSPDTTVMALAQGVGYAPHSTYTASLEMAQACRALCSEAGMPMSVHLAEFQGELEFIREGRNHEVEELLYRANAYDPQWKGVGVSPVQFFADNGLFDGPTYAIHVNYVEPGDLDLLSDLKPTVVYCPRSHAFFKHAKHPIEQLLDAGVPVALGTDSLASNSMLSPLNEAELVRDLFPAIPATTIFKAITTGALGPLSWASRLGQLMPGCQADLAVFSLNGDPGDGFDELFDAVIKQGRSAMTVAAGKIVHKA